MRDFGRAEQVLDRILALAPDDGTTYVDKVALAMQRAGDPTLAKSYELRPPSALYDEGLAYGYTAWLAAVFDRDYERALRVLDDISGDRVFNGDLRTSTLPKAALEARTYRLAGDAAKAREAYEVVRRDTEPLLAAETAATGDVMSVAALYLTLAEARAALGERERALETLARAVALVPKSADAVLGSAVQLAAILNVLVPAGETAAAMRELADYLGAAGHWGAAGLHADPRLDALREDPDWLTLVATHTVR
jgi:tetratricopeptide (TPR) repeat protein